MAKILKGKGVYTLVTDGSVTVVGNTVEFDQNISVVRSIEENTIPTSESPVTLNNHEDMAYVLPSKATSGSDLEVQIGSLASIPKDAVIVACKLGSAIISFIATN